MRQHVGAFDDNLAVLANGNAALSAFEFDLVVRFDYNAFTVDTQLPFTLRRFICCGRHFDHAFQRFFQQTDDDRFAVVVVLKHHQYVAAALAWLGEFVTVKVRQQLRSARRRAADGHENLSGGTGLRQTRDRRADARRDRNRHRFKWINNWF